MCSVDAEVLMRLVRAGQISAEQAAWAHEQSETRGCSISRVLLESGVVEAQVIRKVVAQISARPSPPPSKAAPSEKKLEDAQGYNGRMLRTLFELCVSQGLIDADEFIRRVARLEAEQEP